MLNPLPEYVEEEVSDEQVKILDLSVGVKQRHPSVEDNIREIVDGFRALGASGDGSSNPSSAYCLGEKEEALELSMNSKRPMKPVRLIYMKQVSHLSYFANIFLFATGGYCVSNGGRRHTRPTIGMFKFGLPAFTIAK